MASRRLDQELVKRGLAPTRSQAENYIKLGYVRVGNKVITKPGHTVSESSEIKITKAEKYVSRAGLKLESANKKFGVNFNGKIILDAGSSTGGFTDYALRHGAQKVMAVDVGTDQLHPSLRGKDKIELHEKTDIRDFTPEQKPDLILADLSFISLRKVLPYLVKIAGPKTEFIIMVKPQFEADPSQINRGVIKNSQIRRKILKDFEDWAKGLFKIIDKADSEVPGEKGNVERFYLLRYTK